MKKLSTFITILLICLGIEAQTIEITITGIDAGKGGNLMIGLFNKEQGYPDKDAVYKAKYVKVTNSTQKVVFTGIPAGEYAANVAHDENSNDIMDTNSLGIPTEGYGFSNNPRSLGPPDFNKTKFKVSEGVHTINIKIKY